MAVSARERETLKAIYRLAPEGGEVRTGDLADALGLAPASATARVKRLAERDLVVHSLYRGVELTAEGRQAAVAAIRRHRTVERFLSDMLGYSWKQADQLAMAFEHALPQEVEDRLYVALDRPATCPHGFPIPPPDATTVAILPALAELAPGDEGVVALSARTSPDVLAFLETLGIRPGVRLRVRERHPFEGPVMVTVEDEDRTVGFQLASQISIRPITGRRSNPSRGTDTSEESA